MTDININKLAHGFAQGEDLQLYCEFNLKLQSITHPSWLKALPHSALTAQLINSEKTQKSISHYLLKAFGLKNNYCFEFSDEVRRTALLSGAKLARLIRLAGLVHLSRVIRHTIRSDEVVNIRNVLSDVDYQFAIHRAAFVLPESKLPTSNLQITDLSEQINRYGMYYLLAFFNAQPSAIVKRVLLKIEYGCAHYADEVPAEFNHALGKLMIEKLKGFLD